jgi:translocation and assembly module TamA
VPRFRRRRNPRQRPRAARAWRDLERGGAVLLATLAALAGTMPDAHAQTATPSLVALSAPASVEPPRPKPPPDTPAVSDTSTPSAPDEAASGDGAGKEAEGLRYRVVVDAPEPLQQTLSRGLDLVRWETFAGMTLPLLTRLAAEARDQAETVARTEGYFSATATSAIETENGATVVRIKVDPGPPTLVRKVDIRLTGPVTADAEEKQRRLAAVLARWPLREGARFRAADWEAAKSRAVAALAEQRYAGASIAFSEALVDPKQRTADLTIELDSGPAFRFGAIDARGLTRLPPEVVESVSPIRAGDDYDEDVLALFQRRLLETGYFATVQVTLDTDPANAEAARVQVVLIEARMKRVELGVGYSTDLGYRSNASYSDFDFLNTAWRWRNELRLDQRLQSIATNFDSPPTSGASWNSFGARARRQDVSGELSELWQVSAAHNWGYERRWPSFISLSYTDERLTVNDQTSHNYATFVGYRGIYRQTDDFLLPRRGLLATVELGGGIPGISAESFGRARGQVTVLLPVGRDDLTLRAEAGAVVSTTTEGIPSIFLFRTGGDETVRGYAFESLGVKQGGATTGGRYLAVASAEYTRWVRDNWGVAAFVDAGNAANTLSDLSPAVGAGFGARLRTPIGPVRVDLAYGFRDAGLRLHFSVGFRF